MYAIGCDVGSQSLKGVVLDPEGRVVSQASRSYAVEYPHPGWAEQDPRDWRHALGEVIRQLLADAGVAAGEVATLGLASQVDGLVAVDAHGDALHAAIIWLDRRASEQVRALGERMDGREVRRRTGLNLDASHVAPKILWLRDHRPEIFARASGLLLPGSALVAWLTGEQVVDHANASSTLLYDVTSRTWSPEMLAAAGLDPARLGRIAPAAEVVAPLRAAPADEIGLTPRTRVVTGTGDEHGASVAAGGIAPGIVIDITGTAEPVCVAATAPVIDELGIVETHGHADPLTWLVENPGFVSGGSVTWFRNAIGGGEPADLDAEAIRLTGPGADGVTFLPTLSGSTAPRWNHAARGVYSGLSLNHGRPHLYRALLEGCTFALRDILDRLHEMGLAGDEIRVVGGGARSELWLQMKADVTGRIVRVLATDEATALGAAMVAAVGAGIFRDLDDAVDRCVRLDERAFVPDASTAAAYADAHARYRRLFDAVEPTFAGLPGDTTGGIPDVAAQLTRH